MNDERTVVYVTKRKTKAGRIAYSLRWIDPTRHQWRCRAVGGNRRKAHYEAALMQREIDRGTYCDLRPCTWQEFTKEHVEKLAGHYNRIQAASILGEFGRETGNTPPKRVTFGQCEAYLAACKARGNKASTLKHKAIVLRAALNMGVKRGYLGSNPTDGLKLERPNVATVRVASEAEEAALLAAAERLFGFRWRTLIAAAFGTGGRRAELLGLSWDDVDLNEGSVLFRQTKGKRDRKTPIPATLAADLRRLQAATLQDGGPFKGLSFDTVRSQWLATVEAAEIPPMKLHNCRATFVTRLLLAGTPITVVQKLAGHSDISTTSKFYSAVNDVDMVEAVRKLEASRTA